MIPDSLSSNQVKNAAGTEVQYELKGRGDEKVEWKIENETPTLPKRLTVQHGYVGSGINRRRRSNFSTLDTVEGQVDSLRWPQIRVSTTIDIPIGNITDYDEVKAAMAKHLSMLGSAGADTTLKYDCSGTAAAALINETL